MAHPRLFEAAAGRAVALASSLNGHDMANLAWAFAAGGHRDALLDTVAAAAPQLDQARIMYKYNVQCIRILSRLRRSSIRHV